MDRIPNLLSRARRSVDACRSARRDGRKGMGHGARRSAFVCTKRDSGKSVAPGRLSVSVCSPRLCWRCGSRSSAISAGRWFMSTVCCTPHMGEHVAAADPVETVATIGPSTDTIPSDATPPVHEPTITLSGDATTPAAESCRQFDRLTLKRRSLSALTRETYCRFSKKVARSATTPDKAKGDFDATSVAAMLEGGKKGGVGFVPGKPDEGSLVKYIRGEMKPQMPKGEDPLTDEQLRIIRQWIAAGAIDDTSGARQHPRPRGRSTAC